MSLNRSVRVFEDLSLRLSEGDVPDPAPGELVVRIHVAGVCGTDLHIVAGMHAPFTYPMTLGHEAAGVVEAVGSGVDIPPGTRVAVYNKLFCGSCDQCLRGRQNLCEDNPRQLGLNVDGGDTDYVAIPAVNAVPIADEVDMASAAVLTCAGMTAVHATRLSGLRPGETAIVNGIGGVGILLVQVAADAGARVIAVADTAEKAALASEHGASEAIVLPTPDHYLDLSRLVRSSTGDRGADVYFELVGTERTMAAGLGALAKRGRFVSTGYTAESLQLHPAELILSEISILSTVAASRLDLSMALGLAAAGKLKVPISAHYPLEAIETALSALRERAVLGRQVLDLVQP